MMAEILSFKNILENWYYDTRIYWKYGTSRPKAVALPHSETMLQINPNDERARRRLVINAGLHRKISRKQLFWKLAIQEFEPQTALDIGVHYGECMLSTTYSDDMKLLAFAMNHELRPFLNCSLEKHPNKNEIECHYDLARDQHGLINSTIDDVLADRNYHQQKLFFKLEVEGYEFQILQGMHKTLEETSNILGFVNFDSELLRSAGENLHDYWDFLRDHFEVYAFEMNGCWRTFQNFSMQELEFLCGENIQMNLVLIRSEGSIQINQRLSSEWQHVSSHRSAA